MRLSRVKHVPNISRDFNPNREFGIPDDFSPDAFIQKVSKKMPLISSVLRAGHAGAVFRDGWLKANRHLQEVQESMVRGDLRLSMDRQQMKDWCNKKARSMDVIFSRHGPEYADLKLREMLEIYGIDYPVKDDLFLCALARSRDELWWRRKVKKIQARHIEEMSRAYRLVQYKQQTYVSDFTVKNRIQDKEATAALLSEIKAVNNEGDEYTIKELADLSVSNPEIKRSELMVRMRGFEEVADRRGLVGEFYTMTCPSKYHPLKINYGWRTVNGKRKKVITGARHNEKFGGYSVSHANDYLVGVGSRIRAALARADINIFGFRVVEPHHDGTPHWHYMLFVNPDDRKRCRKIFARYAYQVDGKEAGAGKARFKAVAIDKSKGSATGYIAKYIAKNINGGGMGGDVDLLGDLVQESSVRVEAWASCHGIRQFQQIGGPSVTVWRELRKLEGAEKDTRTEALRLAADASNWAAFVELMGGPFCGRDQALKVAYWHETSTETHELCGAESAEYLDSPVSKYGDVNKGKIIGLYRGAELIVTRFYRWTVERIASPRDLTVASLSGVTADSNCLPEVGSFFSLRGQNWPPWSSVNNCTG